ncbi:MAG: PDZ domain-containing protein [Nitrososphaerota archaeon]|nr:PDZ domain-containing protein [Nitrososphaerota archaeon]
MTASVGVIGALARPLPWAEFIFKGLIQTDAAINPGISGGPLADINGNSIGINTAMVPNAQGVGFAISINAVKRVVDQLFTSGRVIRPWLGISGVNFTTEVARRYNIREQSGVLIVDLIRGGPSFESGLRSGDVIFRVGDEEIKHMKGLLLSLSKLGVGSIVQIEYSRSGMKKATALRFLEVPPKLQSCQTQI